MSPSPPHTNPASSPVVDEGKPDEPPAEAAADLPASEIDQAEEGADGHQDHEKPTEEPTAPLPDEQPPLPDEQPPLPPGPAPAPVHQKNDWAAIWNPQAGKYYFHNSVTGLTTWDNPLAPSPSTSATHSLSHPNPHPHPQPSTSTHPSNPQPSTSTSPAAPASTPNFGGIDPDLAYLDPSLARFATAASSAPSFAASFNAKTGRFQAGGPHAGGVVSRQEEHYYDAKGWREGLDGKGLAAMGRGGGGGGGGGDGNEGEGRKRPSSKEVERFKAEKAEKKRRKLTTWLGK